MVFTIAATV